MEIIFHAHHAVMSDTLRGRAERTVRKLAARMKRPVDATIRFAQDGPFRRVEIELRPARRRPIIAAGEGRTFGPALADAAGRMATQLTRVKRTPKARGAPVDRA
ncbi:MAG TPA: HPF/RaiA family ribosome-associated protein [Gemmatimonadaceae bacterium]|jgi:hypothetical protein|nr:HPF/RaiA family ribosome-associated protein [Gemmatimonadaceae bacterium]